MYDGDCTVGFSDVKAIGFGPAGRSGFGASLDLRCCPAWGDGWILTTGAAVVGLAAVLGGEPFLSPGKFPAAWMAADNEAPKS